MSVTKWKVLESEFGTPHVVPAKPDGELSGMHELSSSCVCRPVVLNERMVVDTIIVHSRTFHDSI